MDRSERNIGSIDRGIRVVVGLVCALVIIWQVFGNVVNIVLLGVATFFMYTAITAVCPLYKKLGKSTAKDPDLE